VLAGSLWPDARRSAILGVGSLSLCLGLAGAGLCGCAHTNAPCPTPPSLLDAHRGQSEAAQRDVGRTTEEVAALEGRREEAARRIQAAKATEDSLARAAEASRSVQARKPRR
jgi:hypothetical protein